MSKDNALEILIAAKKALSQMESGSTFTTKYVANRLASAADKNPHDHLIGNMRDVFLKKAKSQAFVTQKEIGDVYDQMLGLSSNQSAFRNELEDLLPQSRKIAEMKKSESKMRIDQGKENLSAGYHNEELSNAFSNLFDLGKNASFSSFKNGEDKSVEKVAIAKLISIGHSPSEINVSGGNEHFALVTASFKRKGGFVSLQMPIQTTGGVALPPQNFIQNGKLVPLTKEELFVAIKDAELSKEAGIKNKFANQRSQDYLDYEKPVLPKGLEKFADLESNLVAAVEQYNPEQIRSAISVVSDELKGFGIHNPQVKVASASKKEIVLDAYIPTVRGVGKVSVPVEFHNGMPSLPSKFAADGNDKSIKVYDFSEEGMSSFLRGIKAGDNTLKMARQTGPLSSMSYHQLMDEIISGVSNKDYKRAEDALATVQDKFGPEHYKSAFDKFSQLLKYSSDYSNTSRVKLIKEAIQKGDLIKFPTTLEWYCPKLGLPISKIAFDEQGRMVPARKKAQSDNVVNEAIINTSKIILT